MLPPTGSWLGTLRRSLDLSKKSYKHFRCNVTSYTLEIPTIELVPGADPSLPEVKEVSRRLIGPPAAVFTVHVTGKSRMLSQRVLRDETVDECG